MSTDPKSSFVRRALPSLVSAPAAGLAFAILHGLDLIADVPLWQLLVILVVGATAGIVAYEEWGDDCTDAQLFARAAVTMTAVTAVTYATGWGPAMGIGYAFQGAIEVRRSGARAAAPAAFWAVAGIASGQAAIAYGIAPTLIDERLSHGAAVLIALGIALMVLILGAAESQREAVEILLREREERFRSLVENAADAVVLADTTGNLLYASPAAQRVFGFDPRELLGVRGFDFVHPDHLPRAGEYFQAVLSTPGPHPAVELLCRLGDGSYRWLEVRATNRLDDPAVRGVIANVTDVHERRSAEEGLREQTARYETLVGVVSDLGVGFVIIDAHGIRYVNDAMCRINGRTPEELYAMRSFMDLVVPEQRATMVERIGRRLEGQVEPEHYEVTIEHKDGHRVELEVSAKRLTIGGQPQVAGVVTDITERKRAEEALRNETARGEALLGAIADLGVGFAIADDGGVRYVNDAWTRLSGYAREDLLRLPSFAEIVVPEEREQVERRLRERLAGGPSPEHYETAILHRSGRRIDLDVSAKLLHADGKPQVVSMVTDITERKRAEAALKQFIANAAHELRTPLTTLVGVAATLATHRDAMTEEEFRESLLSLKRQGERTGQLIQNLLDLSKVETGKFEVELRPVHLGHATAAALDAVPPPPGKRVEVHVPPDLRVDADPIRLEQVFVNLLTNAYRYGGSTIVVEAARNGDGVRATVSDDGPGIPPDLVRNMFDPFYRGPATQTISGSGLGLAICRALMEMFDGGIEHEAVEPTGARFVLTFRGS